MTMVTDGLAGSISRQVIRERKRRLTEGLALAEPTAGSRWARPFFSCGR